MKEKLMLASLSIALSLVSFKATYAKDSYDWIIRSRALYVKTDTKGKPTTLGGNVTTGSDQVPEIDFTRFFGKNFAAELIVATTSHDVSLRGSPGLGTASTSLGSINLLPPTLTAQYHFNPEGKVRPYAGAGLNYTFFYGMKSPSTTISKVRYQNHLGYALQAGFDYMIDERFSINFDVKKIFLKTHVVVTGTDSAHYNANVRLDPWLFGVGLGYRF